MSTNTAPSPAVYRSPINHGESREKIKQAELVLPAGMWGQVRDYLFSDCSREYACYLLCGIAQRETVLRLLGCFLILPEPGDYVSHSLGSVHLKQDLLREALRECERLGLSLIDIHSHPFAGSVVHFSSVDEADEQEKAQWFAEHLPSTAYGSIVMGRESQEARLRSFGGRTKPIPLSVRSLDAPLQAGISGASGALGSKTSEMVDRHVRAFGLDGQQRLSSAHIGIVGLGGIGAGLALGLCRLGVEQFTLVDPDRAEPHNLNRLSGMTEADGLRGRCKTHIVRRELRRIRPDVQCTLRTSDVLRRATWRSLLNCDLIIACTDNHSSRMLLNTLTEQYLIPQVSIGSLIEANEAKVESACGHVRVLLPGPQRPCLLCSGIIDPTEVYYERAPDGARREAARRGYIANFDEPAPAVVHLNGVLIHLALVEIHNLFCGFKQVAPYLFYDLLTQETLSITEQPSECATCSPNGGYFGRGDLVDLGNFFQEMLPK